ncbi:MAG: hypothetical protein ACT443_05615 [Gemmatimonadota bacterium]
MKRTFTCTFTFTCTWTVALAGCSLLRPDPEIVTRTDTVTVVKEVAPPLPEGDSAELCLSTGMTAQVRITPQGDTLIGAARVNLATLRPVLDFAGAYAQEWPDTVRFERRLYRKSGVVAKRTCDELKQVGEQRGVPIFAEVTAPQGLPAIEVPVRPGAFQTYTIPERSRRR